MPLVLDVPCSSSTGLEIFWARLFCNIIIRKDDVNTMRSPSGRNFEALKCLYSHIVKGSFIRGVAIFLKTKSYDLYMKYLYFHLIEI